MINTIKQHTEEKHYNIDEDRSEETFEHEIVDISTENNAPIEDTSVSSSLENVENWSELKTNLEHIFPDMDNNKKKNKTQCSNLQFNLCTDNKEIVYTRFDIGQVVVFESKRIFNFQIGW